MIVLGVDPGLNGAVAVLEVELGRRPRLIAAREIPTFKVETAARRRVDPVALHDWVRAYGPAVAFIERAQAMPDQGSSSGFVYGRAVGTIEGAVQCAGVKLFTVEASVWKRAEGLPGGRENKEQARLRAIALFPDLAETLFPLKKHHQRAEAALIGKHGAEQHLRRAA